MDPPGSVPVRRRKREMVVERARRVVGTRQLLSASFDLLLRSGDQMRRASFYVGLIVLGTAGPFALALWGSLLTGYDFAGLGPGASDATTGWLGLLMLLLIAGVLVASVDSTAMAIALLGGAFAGRPVTIRETDKLTGAFADPYEVAAVADKLETWSRLCFEFLDRAGVR